MSVASGSAAVRVFVLSVTRDLSDELGGEIAEAVTASGHELTGRDLVLPKGDDPAVALGRRLHDKRSTVVLVCGSATREGQDAGSVAVSRRIKRAVPGLAESYAAISGNDSGDVHGGYTEDRLLVFSLPDDVASSLAFAREHVLPRLSALVAGAEAAFEEEAPQPPAELPAVVEGATVPDGVSVTQITSPKPAEEKEAISTGWESGLRAMKGEMKKGWPTVPEAFGKLAACNDVIDSSGQRALVTLANGRSYGAFGWPDLNRVDAKILLIAEGEPIPEIIALHRHPHPTGTVTDDGGPLLPTRDLNELSERITGRAIPTQGELFAVEAGAVFVRVERRVLRWDGKREVDQGTVSQTLASLMLKWSQR